MASIRALALLSGIGLATAAQTPREAQAQADSSWYHKGVHVSRYSQAPRKLVWTLVVPASADRAWAAWTDPEEMVTWAGPGAETDLRPGGTWEVHFEPDRPKGQRGSDANRIISITPQRELVIEAGAPREFPTVREEKTRFTVTLEPVGESFTRITAEQTRWREGEEWDRAYAYLAEANAEWLSWLLKRYVEGPIDWAAMMQQ